MRVPKDGADFPCKYTKMGQAAALGFSPFFCEHRELKKHSMNIHLSILWKSKSTAQSANFS